MTDQEPPLDPPEATVAHEPEFERIPPIQGTLESRVSAMILHVATHNSFDKRELIELLKDVNNAIRQADENFKSIVSLADAIDYDIELLKNLKVGRKQA